MTETCFSLGLSQPGTRERCKLLEPDEILLLTVAEWASEIVLNRAGISGRFGSGVARTVGLSSKLAEVGGAGRVRASLWQGSSRRSCECNELQICLIGDTSEAMNCGYLGRARSGSDVMLRTIEYRLS